jgi:hypothetical protein
MKNSMIVIMLILIMAGCKKDHPDNNNNNNNNNRGHLILKMSYHSGAKKTGGKVAGKARSDTLYNQFGDYITSISPTVFIGKFLDMRLINYTDGQSMGNYGFNVIDNNVPIDSSNRLADFSSNASVNFDLDLDKLHLEGSIASFNLFVFIYLYFYQEFELPLPYEQIAHLPFLEFGSNNTLMGFDSWWIGGNRTGRMIKGSSDPFLAPVFDSTWTGFNGNFPMMPKNFVFGSTDSTYIFHSPVSHQSSIHNPLGQEGYIIRSNAYNPVSFQLPAAEETETVNGSMTFNTQNLIQIYAGADNIPYTSDDIFVYAPRFWERLSITMSAN